MYSTTKRCSLHKNIDPGFCLLHGLYCYPSCHQKTYPDCSVSNTDHAASHLKQELETLATKLHNALQSCKSTKTTLNDQIDDAQHQGDEAIDHVTEFCEQLQSTIQNFRQEVIEKIRALTADRTDTITEQLQKSKELEVFLAELNETVCIDDTSDEYIRNADQKSFGCHVDPFKLTMKAIELRNRLAQIQPVVINGDHFSIFFQDDPSINDQLSNRLIAVCDALGTSPEGCSQTSNSDRPASPPQTSWKVQTYQDTDVHSIYSGARGAPSIHELDSFREITSRGNPAPADYFREITKVDNPANDSFRRFLFGSELVVRFARSSAGLYILIASQGPSKISKVDESERTVVTEKTNARIWDMFVRGEELFVVFASDRTINVYRLEDLRLMRLIRTRGICGRIVCTDHDLVVTFIQKNSRVCRLSETGHLTHESSCNFTFPRGLNMTSGGDRIIVLGGDAGRIIVLSADLTLINEVINLEIVRPRCSCVVEESVFVACHESVVELDSHGRYKRTVLDKEDGIVDPYELSYDAQSRKLVVSSNTQSEKSIVFAPVPVQSAWSKYCRST